MKKLVAILLTFLLILTGCNNKIEVKKIEVKKLDKDITIDAIRFKEEYDEVSEDNIYKYETIDSVIDILKNGSGIIYFGFPTCKICGDILPVLNDVAKEKEIEKIYYYNFKEIRKNNTKEYSDLTSILSDYLEEDDEGNKKLTAPTIVFIKDGNIIDVYTSKKELTEEINDYFSNTIDELLKYESSVIEEESEEIIEEKNMSNN